MPKFINSFFALLALPFVAGCGISSIGTGPFIEGVPLEQSPTAEAEITLMSAEVVTPAGTASAELVAVPEQQCLFTQCDKQGVILSPGDRRQFKRENPIDEVARSLQHQVTWEPTSDWKIQGRVDAGFSDPQLMARRKWDDSPIGLPGEVRLTAKPNEVRAEVTLRWGR